VNRDNVLFVIVGLLIGFITGYLVHEIMASRQPPRLVHGQGQAAPAAPAPAAPATSPDGGLDAKRAEIQQIETHLTSHPEDAQALLHLANLSYDVRDWRECVDAYDRYLKLRPEDPDILTDLGTCYRGIGDPKKALGLFDRAETLDPRHWQSRYNKVVVLAFDLKDYAAAERVLDELRALQPNNPDVQRLADEVARQRGTS